jgi:NTE family protein
MTMAKAAARKPRIGLALGGGAARGWSHLGVIEALAEAGITADIVCGTSIGAVVGAAYVADQFPALKRFAEKLTRREMVALLDLKMTGGGLLDGSRIMTALKKLGIDGDIESFARPFAAVATDLETGREVWLRTGPIIDAVRASMALPGVLSPARGDGQWLGDGGIVNPVPVSTCRALGADIVIAVNVNSEMVNPFEPSGLRRVSADFTEASGEFIRRLIEQVPAPFRAQAAAIAPKLLRPPLGAPGYFDVLVNSLNVMQQQITRSRLAGEPPHVLISPRVATIGAFEFNRAAEAIAEGRASAAHALPEIKRLLGSD